MSDVVHVHDKGHVRTIVLNRPDKMNALSHALAWAIVGEVQKAAHDDDVWVIALTGSGKAFCAGLDLTGPGEDVSPLPPQARLLDDVSWVGRAWRGWVRGRGSSEGAVARGGAMGWGTGSNGAGGVWVLCC